MGRRGPKNRPAKQSNKQEVWRDHKEVSENTYFRKYYMLQFEPYFPDKKEFQVFWSSMKERLPVVFRVNSNQPNYRSFIDKLENGNMVSNDKFEGEFEPKEPIKIQRIPWYPLVYQINTTKQQFKKSKMLDRLHDFIEKATDAGLTTRQELVSMMPPLFLDIKSTDLVLDMCAAPGSKTSQMLQMLYSDQKYLAEGGVVANDVEYSRAQMLIHQVQRSGTAGMAVINHNGQFLPQLYKQGTKTLFDKILADVPCSGDGATRKLPNKWSDWHSNDGAVLHPLQLNILMRGINLLKPNGLLLYSTCSLNPYEDEAVLLELMRRVSEGLQIVDIHDRGINGRRGLNFWHVLESKGKQKKATEMKNEQDDLFNVYKSYEQGQMPTKIKKSLFPEPLQTMQKYGISNSMRILPHDHNSGGFFLALLRKKENFKWKFQDNLKGQQEQKALDAQMEAVQENLPVMEEEEVKEVKEPIQEEEQVREQKVPILQPQKKKFEHPRKKKEVSKVVEEYVLIDDNEFKILKQYYGLTDDKFQQCLFVKKNEDQRRKVTLVSKAISDIVLSDKQQKLKLINMGCRAFQKGKESFAGHECLYRLCQQSILFMLPLMNKRKIRVNLNLFKKLIEKITIKHDQIEDEPIRKQIQEIPQGSFVVYLEETLHGVNIVDALVSQNFKTAMNIMVSKVDLQSLRIRYF